jgi:hypothetical protein
MRFLQCGCAWGNRAAMWCQPVPLRRCWTRRRDRVGSLTSNRQRPRVRELRVTSGDRAAAGQVTASYCPGRRGFVHGRRAGASHSCGPRAVSDSGDLYRSVPSILARCRQRALNRFHTSRWLKSAGLAAGRSGRYSGPDRHTVVHVADAAGPMSVGRDIRTTAGMHEPKTTKSDLTCPPMLDELGER